MDAGPEGKEKSVGIWRWATERLKEYMIKGFTMDDERLKNLGGSVPVATACVKNWLICKSIRNI